MRIVIDTNVWVSALLWPDSLPSRVLQMIIRDHTVILSAEIIGELRDVYTRKFSHKLPDFESAGVARDRFAELRRAALKVRKSLSNGYI